MTWLEKFQELCQQAPDELKPHLNRYRKGEPILGTVPPHLVKMAWAVEQLIGRLEKVAVEHKKSCKGDGGDDCRDFWREGASLEDQIETAKRIFFTSVREELGIDSYEHPDIAIAEGWRVVSSPQEDPLEQILRGAIPLTMGREIKDA